MKSIIITLVGLLMSFSTKTMEEANNSSHIQVAILLDTSGSMSGLIEQAKSQLWSILNTLSDAQKEGESATIEMALYEYGNNGLSSRNGWVSQRVPFTNDMDKISESLFSMTTNGGSEYCGTAIKHAVNELEWREVSGLRVIYIAGNESFAQGKFHYRDASRLAVNKEIVVNTIFCGDRQTGINLEWESGAVLAKGSYNYINHNQQTVYVHSPYDDEIAQLNTSLNRTYVSINIKGNSAIENMNTQDKNAESYSKANYVKRSIYKSKKVYDNSSWDLVDAYAKDKNIINDLKIVPTGFESKEAEYIERKVKKLTQEREAINQRIKELAHLRKCYVQENAPDQQSGFERVIVESVKKLLRQKQFKI